MLFINRTAVITAILIILTTSIYSCSSPSAADKESDSTSVPADTINTTRADIDTIPRDTTK